MSLPDRGAWTRPGDAACLVSAGAAVIAEAAAALHDFMDVSTDIGVTGTWPWVAASLPDRESHLRPWLVSVGHGGLTAAAVLVDDDSGPVTRTTLVGTAERHRGILAAADEDSARVLGETLADALVDRVREFTLGMSAGVRRTLRKSANRLKTDGVTARTDVAETSADILPLLPLLESISRDRDHASGRPSPLDDPYRRRLWQRRVRALASTRTLRLATLWLDDDLAAYVLGVDDGDTYRVLEGRHVANWGRYSPGRLLEAAVLEAAAGRAHCRTLDWMTDIAPESLLATNDEEHFVVVRGRT